jgi:hypothetical protein
MRSSPKEIKTEKAHRSAMGFFYAPQPVPAVLFSVMEAFP